MVAAIGSSANAGGTAGTSPVSGIEARIALYQKQLAECVNCESAKTPEGKVNIQAISDRISAARARIEEVETTKRGGAAGLNNNADEKAIDAGHTQSSPVSASDFQAEPAPKTGVSSLGNRVDTFA